MPVTYRDRCLSPFHRQVFDCWQEFYTTPPNTLSEIYDEFIFENKYICSDNKPLQARELKLLDKETQDLVMGDILTIQGQILKFDEFREKTGLDIDTMSYNKIISAIPTQWKEKMKDKTIPDLNKRKVPRITVKGKKSRSC